MATLYVENVPDELYEALRARARERRKSISSEVVSLLAENIPTKAELLRRKKLLTCALKLSSAQSTSGQLSAEDLLQQDRNR
jgi:plasmid stability protein